MQAFIRLLYKLIVSSNGRIDFPCTCWILFKGNVSSLVQSETYHIFLLSKSSHRQSVHPLSFGRVELLIPTCFLRQKHRAQNKGPEISDVMLHGPVQLRRDESTYALILSSFTSFVQHLYIFSINSIHDVQTDERIIIRLLLF